MGADMALVLWLLMALVPCLIGMGALRILYGSQTTQEMGLADCILTGGMICIGLAEAANLGAVALGWSFSRCVNVFVIEVIVVVLAAAVVLLVCRCKGACVVKGFLRQGNGDGIGIGKSTATESGGKPFLTEYLPWFAFALLVLIQLIYVMTEQGVYVDGDMTLETVVSFQQTDAVYQVNPMTGRPYTLGIPSRLKILCLPTLYGILSQAFGIDAELLVYGMVPGFVLLGSYLAFSTVARQIFPGKSYWRGVFMAFTALLLGVGNYLYGMDGFGVMHAGFRGVTIRGAILIPYVFGLLLRKKYKLVLLCICVEACIVWTLYGMGACLLISMAMVVIQLIMSGYAKRQSRGEEAK